MSTIPPRFLDELRDRLTLSEVIGRRVKVVRAGREHKACCPFHHEKTPSFTISDEKQFYHCFGCGAHGDVIEFLMQNDRLTFMEAVEALAAEAGMQVPKSSPQAIEQAKKEKSLHSLVDDTALFFSEKLQDKRLPDAARYLNERGLTQTQIDSFRIGYSPADGKLLISYLKDKGYSVEQMKEAGVARVSERNGDIYSFFRDRVMFPVADKRGRVVAFGGRVLPEHIRPLQPGAPKPPKYINTSETPLFHKGQMLYGEPHARQAAVDGQPIIVVEGYLDVIACFGAGFRGAVAPLGTALTEEQIGVLWKMIQAEDKTPILCFDGDDAGRRAAGRACANLLPLLKPWHSARFAFLPQGQDPDSLIRSQGPKAFAAVIEQAMPLMDFLWLHHTGGRALTTPEARAGLAATLEAEAALIPDRNVQQYYKQVFRDRLYKSFVPQKGSKGQFKGKPLMDPPLPPRRPAGSAEAVSRLVMMATLLNHPYIFENAEKDFERIDYHDVRLDGLRQAILETLYDNSLLDRTALHSHLKRLGFSAELDQVLNEAVYTHAGFARPDSQQEIVLAGWSDTVKFMNSRSILMELQQAGRALASECTTENERRLMGLQDAAKVAQE
jgi:DNA primase